MRNYTCRSLTKEKELWSSERSRLQQEQERLTSERNKALASCDQLMAQSASSSSQQDEMARQRRELLLEKDQLLTKLQVLQTEFEKVCTQNIYALYWQRSPDIPIHMHVLYITRLLVREMKFFTSFPSYSSRSKTSLEIHNK